MSACRAPTEADAQIDTVVQPDISVVCDKAKLDERGCRGAPDWIVEVLSPGTAGHDQIVKRALYERVGVREFWLVHPIDKLVIIYLLENGAYGKPALQELLLRLSAMVEDNPQISELDFNPVKVLPAGQGYWVVDARIAIG